MTPPPCSEHLITDTMVPEIGSHPGWVSRIPSLLRSITIGVRLLGTALHTVHCIPSTIVLRPMLLICLYSRGMSTLQRLTGCLELGRLPMLGAVPAPGALTSYRYSVPSIVYPRVHVV